MASSSTQQQLDEVRDPRGLCTWNISHPTKVVDQIPVKKMALAVKEQPRTAENDSSKTFFDLPWEMKVWMMSFVPRTSFPMASLVCQEWFDVVLDPELWQNVELNGEDMTVEKAVQVVSRTTMMKALSLTDWSEGVELILDEVSETAPNLESLRLSWVTFNKHGVITRLLQKCQRLRDFDIRFCTFPADSIHLLDTLSECGQLRRLRIVDNAGMAPLNMSLPRAWGQLSEVHLDSQGWEASDPEFEVIVSNAGSYINKLSICRLKNPESYAQFAKLTNLSELHVSSPTHLTDACLMDGLGSLQNLRLLSMPRADSITPDGLFVFLTSAIVVSSLETLNLSSTTELLDTHLASISWNCPRLTRLFLNNCLKFSADGLVYMVQNLPQLRLLDIRGCQQLRMPSVYDEIKCHNPLLQVCR